MDTPDAIVLENERLSRRELLARAAAIGATAVVGSTLSGRVANAEERGDGQLPSPPPAPLTELEVEAVPLSHDDLSFTPSKWATNGFTWTGNPLFFWWGYITGMPNQRNPILLIRGYGNGPSVGALGHSEFQPGLFRAGVPLATAAGTMFLSPAGNTFSGALDTGGFHKRSAPGDPDNLGGPNELTYTMSGTAPDAASMLYNAGTRAHHMVEHTTGGTPLLDIRADYVPLIPAISPPAPFALYFTGAATAQGTYRGREVFFMSGFDRFVTANTFGAALANPLYQAFVFSGIHEDGRREWGASYITGTNSNNFSGFGAYCKEGEEPICSHDVHLDCTWVQNADNPTQIAPLNAVYRWEQNGRRAELHFNGTHSGGREVFGTWRERNSPGRFVRSMAALEYGINASANPVPIAYVYTPSTALS
jgi:hypothetical protein